jgi:hypothetical protein
MAAEETGEFCMLRFAESPVMGGGCGVGEVRGASFDCEP